MINPPSHLKYGTRNPLLLTPTQNYVLFGVIFAGHIAVIIALVLGASKNKNALESLARAAELDRRQAPMEGTVERATFERPPRAETTPPLEPGPARSLHISVPNDWEWQGCRLQEGSRAVEILFAPPR